jgi:para-nitrobenzyl esterase
MFGTYMKKENSRVFIGIVCVLSLLSIDTSFASGTRAQAARQSVATKVAIVTKNGPLAGLETEGIYAYKGIPYAKAPVGDLRFAPPQDVEPWTAERDCTKYGPIAVQQFTVPDVLDNTDQSEDCLTLNIWTPTAPRTSDRLPVYVYIHGGGYEAGTGNAKSYDGTSFARNGVIMVTINYRLSTLGFFASQETYNQYGTTGNWGILDQIKALEWVQKNIADFGGDPAQVTVGGESAGSWSVSALILSPLAKGLFRSAIMESGTILALPTVTPYRSNLQKSIGLSQVIADLFGASDTAAGLNQMRKADATVLNYLSPFTPDQSVVPAFFMLPVFDGTVLPLDPVAALRAGNFNHVPILIGFNRDEGALFIPPTIDSKSYEVFALRTIGKNWRTIVDHFPVDEHNSAAQRAQQLLAYEWFSGGAKLFADTLAGDNKVYMYQYNFVRPSPFPGLPSGAYHGAELAYVFNNLAIRGSYEKEQEKLAEEMHIRWINFIKTGDPNIGINLPTDNTWPQYDPAKAEVIFFDGNVTVGTLPDRENLDFAINVLYSIGN